MICLHQHKPKEHGVNYEPRPAVWQFRIAPFGFNQFTGRQWFVTLSGLNVASRPGRFGEVGLRPRSSGKPNRKQTFVPRAFPL